MKDEEMKAKQVVLNDFKSRVETVTDRFNTKSSQLTKATEIIKKLKALYFSPVVTKDDVKRQDEILAEVEQFLKADVGTKNYEEQDKILKTKLL